MRLAATSRQMRRDPGAVGVGEDVLLALARDEQVGEGLAERVGDFGEGETLLAVRAEQDDVRDLDAPRREDIAPGVVRLLFDGRVDGTFEGEIGGDGRSAHGGSEYADERRAWRGREGDRIRSRKRIGGDVGRNRAGSRDCRMLIAATSAIKL